ncbi:MAG: hypothetical protein L6Q49_10900, partial [Anaerolineales bacterium]|nr:hypothetical protein [Anaerolineales bacterium]
INPKFNRDTYERRWTWKRNKKNAFSALIRVTFALKNELTHETLISRVSHVSIHYLLLVC